MEMSGRQRQGESRKDLADKLTLIAIRQLQTSGDYKKERMNRIKKYEELYQGKVPRKFRQLFNVNFPVFTGFVDTLASDFSDPITCKFREQDPSDYFKAKKIQSAWNKDSKSLKPSGMWDLKTRLDKKNAIMCGRGIEKYYASSDPGYESHFDVVDYNFFHCQPTGGPILENHLFCGEEGIMRTEAQMQSLADSGAYDEDQVAKLLTSSKSSDYQSLVSQDTESYLARFRALGLDPQSHTYLGEPTYNLVQWCLTYNNKRYYILFDPYSKIWVRFDELHDVFSGDYYPYTSWATHEDPRVFWSVGYADFFYPVSDAVITFLNQELTNREKQNFNARAYDESMFEDEQKLDEAQYRPDSLVPVNTKQGTKRIQDGIYRFDTPELQGTIDLTQWLMDQTGKWTGASEISAGGAPKPGTKAYVQFQQQQQIAKRLSYKALSYQECYQQIGLRYIEGLKDHMPAKMAIKMVGEQGYDHWDEITKEDLNLTRTPLIEIMSTTAQEQADKLKIDARTDAFNMTEQSSNINDRVRTEYILRTVGSFDDNDIAMLMDVNDSVDKNTQAKASIAIKRMMEKKKPETNYLADLSFLKIIQRFQLDHTEMLKKRGIYDDFEQYIIAHGEIAAKNMATLSKQIQMEQKLNAMKTGKPIPGQDPQQGAPQQGAKPSPPQMLPKPTVSR